MKSFVSSKSTKKGKSVKINLAVAWYKSEQWQQLREVSVDSDELEDTWEEWLTIAERNLKNIIVQGVFSQKVLLDVEELQAWCKERGFQVNGESRSYYAAWLLQEMDKVRCS